ncbi:MAG: tyrosine-type recombinase/integrase, partial [Bacteroidota bacterium]|nr:tyrosine-type recombinase/integrase [Bacteroidota bacterium]
KHLTTHVARHTFATAVTLENDVPIETVSQMLGHKSIKTTQIYAKVTHRKMSNNMKALEGKLSLITNISTCKSANNENDCKR